MRTRVSMCVAVVASVAAAVLVPISAPGESVAQAETPTPASTAHTTIVASPHTFLRPAATISAVPVRSNYENATRIVSRDVGVSVLLPDGHALWLFGDTSIVQKVKSYWVWKTFIDGSTALMVRNTPGQVPSGGEVPTGQPARFIPVPNDVYLPDGSKRVCTRDTAAFAARWPTGAAVMPNNKAQVLVTYSEVCITKKSKITRIRTEGWGYLLYNWKTHHIVRGPVDVFKPQRSGAAIVPSKVFGSPQVNSGHLTVFSSQCTAQFVSCTGGHVFAATLPSTTTAMDKPGSYVPVQLTTDSSGTWRPLTISVGRYSTGLRLVEMISIQGTYAIFTAPTAGAAWHLTASGTLPKCPSHVSFCFGLEGHPELSSATKTFVSYKDPDSGPGGHVVVSALPT